MEHLYPKRIFTCFITILSLLSCYKVTAQCPYGGTAGTTAYDTTIVLGTGVIATQLKFPKFDPQTGMITCVRFCVTITGIIDTLSFENYATSTQIASYTYIRKDTITGPGIPTYLTSSANIISPNYVLGPFDGMGNLGAGPDFYSQGSDTILKRTLCINLSDSAFIATNFYGAPGDSVAYNYNVDADLNLATGGSIDPFALSSALVNFHFEYCTCPAVALPLNIRNLLVSKIADNEVSVTWKGVEEQNASYRYIVEMSRDGYNFSEAGEVPRNSKEDYKYIYNTGQNEKGVFFFRVKQVYSSGQTLYTDTKQVYLENSRPPKFTLSPNPSNGIVGIKFDNNESGKMMMQVFNSSGQKVMQKDILVAGTSYQQVGTLESGLYWLRLTDQKTGIAYVNQLLIK